MESEDDANLIASLRRRLARERKARLEAEAIAERSTRALYELNRMKNEFISTISHELRTPLTTIIGISGILENQMDKLDAQTCSDFLKRIQSQGERLNKMVDQMIKAAALHAREAEAHTQEFNFRDLAEDMLNSMHVGTISMRWDVPEDLPIIRADTEMIGDILRSLVDNAVKYSPDGGVFTVGAVVDDGGFKFWVEDQGIGMGPDQIKHVFEPFWQADSSDTRQFGGMGLGLHIVRLLTSILGGQIAVNSEVGKGTRVDVVLGHEAVKTQARLVGAY